jgi:hypothetical protein
MLRAYFDAGSTRVGLPVFYVGGYISTEAAWGRFYESWRQFLHRYELESFHMTEFVARVGPYKAWSESRRLEAMQSIVDMLKRHVKFGVSAMILEEDFQALTVEEQGKVGLLYGVGITSCIGSTAKTAQTLGLFDPVAYVFDIGDLGQGKVKVALEELFERKPREYELDRLLVHSISFERKTEALPLQIADFLAFETGRYAPIAVGASTAQVRLSLQEAVAAVLHIGVTWDTAKIRDLLSRP